METSWGRWRGGRWWAGVALVVVSVLAGCSGSGSRLPGGAAGAAPGGARFAPPAVSVGRAVLPGLGAAGGWAALGAEEGRAGSGGWQIPVSGRGGLHEVEGFTDRSSVVAGEPVRLYASVADRSWTVSVYRLGWYRGALARLVWRSRVLAGRVQPPPVLLAATRTVSTRWLPSVTVGTGGWVAGDYLLRLVTDRGAARYVPVTVRSASTAGAVVLVNGVTTWQAYNSWGGHSLYGGASGGAGQRSYVVSFDRPYDGSGADELVNRELPVVALAERLHLHVAYVTDIDLHERPGLLTGARAVVSLGHDEYYSSVMRAALVTARAAGTNIAFLGANAIYRHIRFAASPLGADRWEVNYRVAGLDPLHGRDDAEVTTQWRAPPLPRPEGALTGALYGCNPTRAAMVVVEPRSWLFAGTGVTAGTALPDVAGPEYDRVTPGSGAPSPLEVLAHSPLVCNGQPDDADMTYYTTASGAGVLDTGTQAWVSFITGCPLHSTGRSPCSLAQQTVTTATANLLATFAAGPAGRRHPAHTTPGLSWPRPAGGPGGPG